MTSPTAPLALPAVRARGKQCAVLSAAGGAALLGCSLALIETNALPLGLPAALIALPGAGLVMHARDLLRFHSR
jgi:hypothetical protein